MNAADCIKTRRSVRSFTEQKVSEELVKEVVELARFAPTWKNTQTPRYYVVQSEELKAKLAQECMLGFTHNTDILLQAPAMVVLAYVEKRCGYERDGSFTTSKEDRWEMFDAGIAAQTFSLAAHEKGLGTCIMGIFDEAKVAEAIHLPEGQKVGAVLALGYADGAPQAPPRKEVDELVKFL